MKYFTQMKKKISSLCKTLLITILTPILEKKSQCSDGQIQDSLNTKHKYNFNKLNLSYYFFKLYTKTKCLRT